jgi:hypothetical protein
MKWPARLSKRPAQGQELPANVVGMSTWIKEKNAGRDRVAEPVEREPTDIHDEAWRHLKTMIHTDPDGAWRPFNVVGDCVSLRRLVIATEACRVEGGIAPVTVEFSVEGRLPRPMPRSASARQIIEEITGYEIVATRKIHVPGEDHPGITNPSVKHNFVSPDASLSDEDVARQLELIDLLAGPLGSAEVAPYSNDDLNIETAGLVGFIGHSAVS